jgi:hypothetical protein
MEDSTCSAMSIDNRRKLKRTHLGRVTTMRGACPGCWTVIEFSEAVTEDRQYPGGHVTHAFNEDGLVLGRCKACDTPFAVRLTNPDLTRFSVGALSIGHVFDPVDAESAALPVLTDAVDVIEAVGQRDFSYDASRHPLYVCHLCGEGVEQPAFTALDADRREIALRYGMYANRLLKGGHGPNPDLAIVRLAFGCTCGHAMVAYFYTKYREEGFPGNGDVSLANVLGARPLATRLAPALYSKDECIAWLHKLLARWMLVFDEVYIISPFVGHQFLKREQQLESWTSLLARLDHVKTRVITRSGQLKRFKTAFEAMTGHQYARLAELGLGSPLIEEAKQGTNFHAKVYCAIGPGHSEVFSGSANLVTGPSKEVMHFHEVASAEDCRAAFLTPLGAKPAATPAGDGRHAIVLDGRRGFDPSLPGARICEAEFWRVVMGDASTVPGGGGL